jgi:hypothetical protein
MCVSAPKEWHGELAKQSLRPERVHAKIAVVEEGGLTNVLAADERVERAAVRTDIERAQATTKK